MAHHKNLVVSESDGYETRDRKQNVLRHENHPLSTVDYRAKDNGLPACSTTADKTKGGLHSSEVLFIINVKQEEDI